MMMDVHIEYLKTIPGVFGALRLTHWVNGEKEESLSVLLFFDKEQIPTHVKLGYKIHCKIHCKSFCPQTTAV